MTKSADLKEYRRRRKKWRQLLHDVPEHGLKRMSPTETLLRMVLGAPIVAVYLIVFVNVLADYSLKSFDLSSYTFTLKASYLTPPEIEVSTMLGLMAVLATIVVAIALTPRTPEQNVSVDAVDIARRQEFLSSGTLFIGIAATSLSWVYALGAFWPLGEHGLSPSRLLLSLIIVGAGLTIALVAAQAEPRLAERVIVAKDSLQRLAFRTGDLRSEAYIRWHIDSSSIQSTWWRLPTAVACCFASALVISIVYLLALGHGYRVIDSSLLRGAGELGVLVVPLVLIVSGVCGIIPLSGVSARRWPVVVGQILLALFMLSVLVFMIWAWIAYPQWAWMAVSSIIYALLVCWPFLLPYYPNSIELRRAVVIAGWPVHHLRRVGLASVYTSQSVIINEMRNRLIGSGRGEPDSLADQSMIFPHVDPHVVSVPPVTRDWLRDVGLHF